MADANNVFDPDETLPLPNDNAMDATTEDNRDSKQSDTAADAAETQRLLHSLQHNNNNMDESLTASLLSHLSSVQVWDESMYHLVIRLVNVVMSGRMEPILCTRILTDGLLPLASISRYTHRSDNDNYHEEKDDDTDWIGKMIRSTVEQLSSAFHDTTTLHHPNGAQVVDEGIKILLPAFLHRLDIDEASSHNAINDATGTAGNGSDTSKSVDDILDQFCSHNNTYTNNANKDNKPHITAALLSALREFDSLSSSRLSKRRIVTNTKHSNAHYQNQPNYEYVDRPTSLIAATIHSLKSQDVEAIPPLVYQLGLLPLGLMGDKRLNSSDVTQIMKLKGKENEKQRGKRLRMMVLQGIVDALEDDVKISDTSNGDKVVTVRDVSKTDEWKWSRYTSLSHLGTCLRMDPELTKAMLALLGGELSSCSLSSPEDNDGNSVLNNENKSNNTAPFRHQKLTPFKLTLSLSMASSIPRIRTTVLEKIRDLILEEETIRIKCGIRWDGTTMGLGRPWMKCLVRCLEGVASGDDRLDNFHENRRVGHVLSCLIQVAQFAECGEKGGGMGSIQGGGCASMILQSLILLGFLLIDCVKKDDLKNRDLVPASALLANTLDMAVMDHASMEDSSANHATARVGRVLLCYLFYQSAAASSHFMTSSLTRGSNEGGTSLCRSILKSTIDKLCGMAPNALEYGKVLTDLLQFSPGSLKSIVHDMEACDGLDVRQKEEVISLAMATNYIPMLIDTLSNLPGGGMHPHVAIQAVIPTVANLLLLQASAGSLRPGLAGYLWKKNDIIDHVDHSYLLAKKSLFCIDEEKRKCAAKLLVSLIGVAAIASSSGNNRKWQTVQDEMRSSLRRCLTQHQQSVRLEAYSSLMALLPTDEVTSDASQTQDSVSPKQSPYDAATQSPNHRLNGTQSFIPPAARSNLSDTVCGILASQLDRYLIAPPEQVQDKLARQQRGNMIGSQLSQMEEVDQSQENEKNMPFRFEMMVSMRPQQTTQGKPKKAVSIAQTLLTEALSRIIEPIGFLIAACNAASSGAPAEDFDITDDTKHQSELCESIKSLRCRMANCNDIEQYLKWLKSNKHIFDITNNSKRKMEMAVGKIATLISVAVASEALLGTCSWENENDDGFIGVDTTSEEVENLFYLRLEAVTRASEIMSSFVNSKPRKKKLKERDTNADSDSPQKKKSKSSKGEDKDDTDTEENAVATTTDINRATQTKNRHLLEEAIKNITPAMPQTFLAKALQKFGAIVESKFTDSTKVDSDDDEDDDAAITKRLAACMTFRRFLITKSIQLVGGTNSIVKAGSPFSPLREDVNGLIASSLSLGQLMFAEFCLHCYQLERTSISPDRSSQELPMTQLSMRAFIICMMGMANKGPFGVNALLKVAICAASRASPSCKEGWEYYSKLNSENSVHEHAPAEELNLKSSLLGIVSRLSSSNKMCLYEELLSQSMHGEAMECANLILAAAPAFSDPNLREFFGVMMLKCYEKRSDESTGVLGVDFGEEEEADSTCLAHVIDVAFQLSNHLDGETHAPIPAGFLGIAARGSIEENLRSARKRAELPMTDIGNWPAKQHDRLRSEIIESSSCCTGIVQQIAWALTANLTVGQHFVETFRPDGPTAKQLRLQCIKTISTTSGPNFDREKSNICQSITACIEIALDNADFITVKLLSNLSGKTLELAQHFVACNLFTISKVICASSPSAEYVDGSGTFASTLLKSAKRLYTNLVRFVLSFTSNPKSMVSKDTEAVLDLMTSTLKPRIAAMLRTLQEKHETTGGKYLAESKIESHGRTASQLVFEKEKLDNALLKVATVLKQAGLKEESIWLGKHVVTSQERDFVIKSIEKAQEREAPKKKTSSGSKRKVKEEHAEKKNKKVKVKRVGEMDDENVASDDDDVSQENSDVESDESEAAECEVVEEADESVSGEEESENDMGEDSGDDAESEEAEFDE